MILSGIFIKNYEGLLPSEKPCSNEEGEIIGVAKFSIKEGDLWVHHHINKENETEINLKMIQPIIGLSISIKK